MQSVNVRGKSTSKGYLDLACDDDGNIIVGIGAELATTITEYNITLTSADTEYSQALPTNTKKIEFWSRGKYAFRHAFTTGKVAGPTAPYLTMKANAFYESPGMLNLSSQTIYFATAASAGDTVEMIVWS